MVQEGNFPALPPLEKEIQKTPEGIRNENRNGLIKKIQAIPQRGSSIPPQEKKNILRARAQALAREPEPAEAGSQIEVVEFLLAHERYAIETEYIREILSLKEVTPLPCTPSFVLGIINIRGRILSVVDIKKFFNLPERSITNLDKIIIIHTDEMEIGILADNILGTKLIPLKTINPLPPTMTGIGAEYLKGVTCERVVVLDTAGILSDQKLIVYEEVE